MRAAMRIYACLAVCLFVGGVAAQDRPAAASATNTNEALVGSYTLPDPLRSLDGTVISDVQAWESVRRPEIVHLFEENQFGKTPHGGPTARFEAWETGVPALNGLAKRTQVRIHFSDDPVAPVIRVLLYTPAAAKSPVPVLQHLSFSPNVLMTDDPGIDEGFGWAADKTRVPGRQGRKVGDFDVTTFLKRGFGVVMIYNGDIDPDFLGGAALGIRSLFGKADKPPSGSDWGTIGTWSWGMSRVLDYLETNPTVDARRVAISGASRLGKAILWTGAQERRFAMVLPLISGEGGAALSRRDYGETIADLTNPKRYPYWFAPNYARWAQNVDRFPVDSHMLLSLIAPRPLLLVVGETDTWSDPRGEYLAARAAEGVYKLYGKRGLEASTEPEVERPILNDMGFFKHKGGHAVLPADLEVMADFMQKHFGSTP